MARRIVARALLVFAVLLAQQTAIAHELWHASGGASQDAKSPLGKKLCELHDLLGTVLGAVGVAKLPLALLSFCDVAFVDVVPAAAQSRALAPQSRGPPAIS